jgi:hypothetical protein
MNKQFLKNFENVLEHFFEEKNSFFSKKTILLNPNQ